MGIASRITDPDNGEAVFITDHSMHVVISPNFAGTLNIIPFRSFFTNAAGSNDLIVDGSSTPVEFSIGANTVSDESRDRHITSVSILLSDAGLEAGLFGALATLTNGLDFEFFDSRIGVVTIDSAIKRNIDFIRLALGNPGFGVGGTGEEYVIQNVSSAPTKAEAYIPVIDLRNTFGLPTGIRLGAGTDSKLTFRVNDALAGLVEFNIIAYGFENLSSSTR